MDVILTIMTIQRKMKGNALKKLTFVSELRESRTVLRAHGYITVEMRCGNSIRDGKRLSQFPQPLIHRWNCRVSGVCSSRHSLASVMRSHDMTGLDSDVVKTSWPAATASDDTWLHM